MLSVRGTGYCDDFYMPQFAPIGLSFAITVLAIIIEFRVHTPFTMPTNSPTTQAQHNDIDASQSAVEPPSVEPSSVGGENRILQATVEEEPLQWWKGNPSPAIRANRLAVATVLLISLYIAFGFRVAEWECPPYWGLAIPFTIIPFILGSAAWLRALVDCALVRWKKTLPYANSKNISGWPPCAPIVLPVLISIWCARNCASVIMGEKRESMRDAENIELGEEGLGLVAGFEGADDEELENPPSYQSSWQAGGSEGSLASIIDHEDDALIKHNS